MDGLSKLAREVSSAKHGPGRHAMPQKESRAAFTRHAMKMHRKNCAQCRLPMRGGIRL